MEKKRLRQTDTEAELATVTETLGEIMEGDVEATSLFLFKR